MQRKPHAQKKTPKEAGAQLKAWRLAAGLTQYELADLVGVSQASLYRWEREGIPAMAGPLFAVLQALEKTPDELFCTPLPTELRGLLLTRAPRNGE